MTKETQPYEFLVRWKDGQLSGSHIQFKQIVKDDDGTILSETPLDPQVVGGDKGFPLADILEKIQSDALEATALMKSERDKAVKDLEDFQAEIQKYLVEKDSIKQQLQSLTDSL